MINLMKTVYKGYRLAKMVYKGYRLAESSKEATCSVLDVNGIPEVCIVIAVGRTALMAAGYYNEQRAEQ